MQSMPIPGWLKLEVCRCLLGEIYPAIRCVAVGLRDDALLLRYYLDRHPTDGDRESIEVVATNIWAAGSVEEAGASRLDVECVFSDAPIGKLDFMGGFIYARRENDLEQVQ
jgi:hypothetical protein